MPSGEGAMHWRHFKPNGITPTCLTGELAGWVNEVYNHMNDPAKEDIIPRIFDFSLRDEIDQLMHIHSEYIFGASSRTYLNAFGSSFSNSAGGANSYIMTYQLKDGPAGFEDIVVAINFGGEEVGFSQQLDGIGIGTQTEDLTGNANFTTPTVEFANGINNSIWISLPPRSYAIYRVGAWGLFEADRSWIGFNVKGNDEFFRVWDNGTGNIQNHDFGFFDPGDNLTLIAYDVKTWKNSGGNVTGGNFYYTIYPKGQRPDNHDFTPLALGWMENIGGEATGNQKWGFEEASINLKNGLSGGEYTLEFYTEVYGENPNKTEFDSNNGNNYLAHFELPCINPTDGGTIAESHTICTGAEPAPFTSTAAATGHTGTLEYKWQYSETGDSGPWTDIEDSDAVTFEPSALTTTTWFRRLARVDCQEDWTGATESNVLEVTVELYHVYRSRQNGNWNDASTWERSIDGGTTWDDSTVYPGEEAVNSCGEPIVSIRDEHVVTLTSDISFDGDVVVANGGTLVTDDHVLSGDGDFTLSAGASLSIGSEDGLSADGSSWVYPTVDACAEHSATIIGETSFSDFIIASCGLPDLPVITADLVINTGESIQLEILSGDLNDATEWQWYSDACGDTPVGSGSVITVSPSVSTTYYVRGEGGCAGTDGPCASVTVGVAEVAIPLSGWALYLGILLMGVFVFVRIRKMM